MLKNVSTVYMEQKAQEDQTVRRGRVRRGYKRKA